MKKKFEKSKEFKMTARASHDVIVPVFTIYIKKKKKYAIIIIILKKRP